MKIHSVSSLSRSTVWAAAVALMLVLVNELMWRFDLLRLFEPLFLITLLLGPALLVVGWFAGRSAKDLALACLLLVVGAVIVAFLMTVLRAPWQSSWVFWSDIGDIPAYALALLETLTWFAAGGVLALGVGWIRNRRTVPV